MILRRLSQSLKTQNWTAIWIEFLLLIVGVFLGIQVANWNEDRSTEKQAKIFTDRLRSDLHVEAWGYEFQIQYYSEVLKNAEKTLAILEGEENISNEQLLISAYRATQYNLQTRRRSSYDEMISTGKISLITDPALREAASIIYTNPVLENFKNEALGSRYREEFRMRVPLKVQSALGENCGDRFVAVGNFEQIKGSLDYPCVTGLDQQLIDKAANILYTDNSIIPFLRLRITDVRTILANLTITNIDSRNSLKLVLGEKP
jgi:hypothetical protein